MEASALLEKMEKVVTDDDWDGVSSAIQVKRHYPHVDVQITDEKIVPSDDRTLVLDKRTSGEGWVIDHHHYDEKPKNFIRLSEDGKTPTSTLVYQVLPERDDSDLFVSALAEINDGLDEYGLKNGSLKEILEKYPVLSKKSKYVTQHMKSEEIYVMADIVMQLANMDPYKAFDIGVKLNPKDVDSSDKLLQLLDNQSMDRMGRYFKFMENFPDDLFKEVMVGDYMIKIANKDSLKFPMSALDRMARQCPGNYMMFKGDSVSIRTYDRSLVELIVDKLGDRVKHYGGRVDWWGITLHSELTYNEFLEML